MSYEQMPWDELYQLRQKYADNPKMQEFLAPFEHRAYAREQVRENPANILGMGMMIPGYQVAKTIGMLGSDKMTTPPSMTQMGQGLAGIGDGISYLLDDLKKKIGMGMRRPSQGDF
jgi:hypothetical protein